MAARLDCPAQERHEGSPEEPILFGIPPEVFPATMEAQPIATC